MARKKTPAPQFAIRSVNITFNVEQFDPEGKLIGVKEVPATLFEAQFKQTVGSLAAMLLEQGNKSSESKAQGEGKKEE